MKHSKLPWEYLKIEFPVEGYDGYRAYHKYDKPVMHTSHQVIRRGKNGQIIESILGDTFPSSSTLNETIEANYRLIVESVNRMENDSTR